MTDDNIVKFPSSEKPPELLVGPFSEYRVVIDGRFIPKLTGHPVSEDEINLIVDGRFGITVSKDKAHEVAWLVAQALAVGAGYPHASATSKDRPFAPIAACIGTVETSDHP